MAPKRTRPKRTPEQLRKSREAAARYKARHPERVAAADRRTKAAWKQRDPVAYQLYRDTMHWRRKGLTPENFFAMVAAQGGRCAICAIPFKDSSKGVPHIDHNHACCPNNKACPRCLRALLCGKCNTGLGQFKESPEVLEIAAHYLRAFSLPSDD